MTLSEARAAAVQAIRAAATTDQIRKVRPVDVLSDRQIPALARGLIPAHQGTGGEAGPADVAVMANGRRASQAIGITAVLIILDRVDLDPDLGGSGRGLAVHDIVAGALEGLPGHGLPRLFVESSIEQMPIAVQEAQLTGGPRGTSKSDPYLALHVFTLHVEWPPAFPEAPLATEAGSSTSAIRDHVAAAIAGGLPSAAVTDAAVGATEERRRVAVQQGTVPRAWIELKTQREAIGGSPDFVERPSMEWQDSETPPRTWRAQAVTQTVVVDVHVAHRTEELADEATLRIVGQLTGSVVVWPGSFDARVLEGGTMVTRRLTGGTYDQGRLDLLMFERAEWDAEAGVAVARLQVSVEAVDPIEPATQAVGMDTVEHDAAYTGFQPFDAGTARRTELTSPGTGMWSVEREPVIGGMAQVLRLKVSPSRIEPVSARWQVGTELVFGSPSAPTAVLEIMSDASWAGATGVADVILLSGELPSVGTGLALRVRDG